MGETVDFQSATLATPPAGTKVAVDTIGGEQYQKVKLYDGTLDSTVGAKVTSEGNLQAITPNRTASGTLGALNAALTVSADGMGTVLFHVTASTLSGDLSFQGTLNGSNWFSTEALVHDLNFFQATVTDPVAGSVYLVKSAGLTSVRAILTAFISGSVTVQASAGSDRGEIRAGLFDAVSGSFARVGNGGQTGALRVTLATDSTGVVKVWDGTRTASVRDTGTSDSLNVAIVDASGNQITSFGGGTQYAEDTAHVSGDQLTLAGVVQQAADAALSTDGDRSLLQVDGSGHLKVNVKAGTVTANAGTNLNTSALALEAGGNLAGVRTAAELIDDSVHADDAARGKSLLIGAVLDDVATTAVTENQAGFLRMSSARRLLTDGSGTTQPVSATSLPLPTGAATSALQTQPGVDIGDVTVNNAAGASAVNVQDGGNSLTVDGTISANLNAGTNNMGRS